MKNIAKLLPFASIALSATPSWSAPPKFPSLICDVRYPDGRAYIDKKIVIPTRQKGVQHLDGEYLRWKYNDQGENCWNGVAGEEVIVPGDRTYILTVSFGVRFPQNNSACFSRDKRVEVKLALRTPEGNGTTEYTDTSAHGDMSLVEGSVLSAGVSKQTYLSSPAPTTLGAKGAVVWAKCTVTYTAQ